MGRGGRLHIFRRPLWRGERVCEQRGRKIHSLHAPEVEGIGKGKAHRPYEFGLKVPVATTLHRSVGGQFVAHVKALPGNPYDGHTLAQVIPAMETQLGATLKRIVADRGYRGHNPPESHKFRVFIAEQSRRVTEAIKRELRRRPAVEPVIGHLKSDHRMGRNFLAHTQGDAVNAVLAAAGYNFKRLQPGSRFSAPRCSQPSPRSQAQNNSPSQRKTVFFTGDYVSNYKFLSRCSRRRQIGLMVMLQYRGSRTPCYWLGKLNQKSTQIYGDSIES